MHKYKVIVIIAFLLVLNVVVQEAYSDHKGKCACNKLPQRFPSTLNYPKQIVSTNSIKTVHTNMALIPAGSYMMGGDDEQAKTDELPKHAVILHAFWMDVVPVTNREFKHFVISKKYVTTAEKKPEWELIKKSLPPNTPKPNESKLVAASLVFTPPNHPVSLDNIGAWWSWMPGASWQHPRGPDSNITGLDSHPVVHVSWDDAIAYCKSVGKRLPTEAEWEWAARGGLKNKKYPWGNEAIDQGMVKANTWQGSFPYQNTLRDKFYYTSPVKHFLPNGYGLYDMAGNVWEWVNDWYHHDYYSMKNQTLQGPLKSYDPDEPYAAKKVLRGGSFLCNESYCSGYRVSARMKSTPDTSMEHVGFRCAEDI